MGRKPVRTQCVAGGSQLLLSSTTTGRFTLWSFNVAIENHIFFIGKSVNHQKHIYFYFHGYVQYAIN